MSKDDDSDWAGFSSAMKQLRQERHADWHTKNMEVLNSCGITFKVTNFGESILFREPNKPKVDFYPSTGRWRVAGKPKTYSGGAAKLLEWYIKQEC